MWTFEKVAVKVLLTSIYIMTNQIMEPVNTAVHTRDAISHNTTIRSYDLYLPVYSYLIGLFIIFVGKNSTLKFLSSFLNPIHLKQHGEIDMMSMWLSNISIAMIGITWYVFQLLCP